MILKFFFSNRSSYRKKSSPLFFFLGMLCVSGPILAVSYSGWTVAGGFGWGMGEIKTHQKYGDIGEELETTARTNLGPSGVMGSIALGYDWEFAQCCLLGFDVYGMLSSMSAKLAESDPVENDTTLKMMNTFGIRMRPGGMIGNRTMIHLTLGVEWAWWKVSATGGAVPALAGVVFDSASLSKRRPGFVYGCGVLTELKRWKTSAIALGLEYVRTTYKQLPALVQNENTNLQVVNQTFKPFTNIVMMRLVYKF